MSNLFKITLFFIALSISSFSFSQEKELDKVLSPYFLVKSDDPNTDQLPLKKTSVQVNIVGVIADITINQVYKNEGENALEAIYTFPASSNAAVYAMEMTIGERIIRAKIEEKQKARNDYEAAKKEGKRASLLEQQRPNVFQMNVANIMPGDEIIVSLKYTEFLIPTEGIYQLIYPTVVGPRYSNKNEISTDKNNYVNTPYLHQGEDSSYDFDIDINLLAGLPIQDISCKTHKINIKYSTTDKAIIKLDDSENKGGNRDFVFQYQLAGDNITSGLMLYEHEDENFFLMMVQPPKRIIKTDIPPREYIFINDVSGSMKGHPMDISKKIMRNLVCNLGPEDRFNVLVFAGTSGWMSDESLPATTENIEKAVYFIDNQKGSGGTEILYALKKALSFPRKFEEMSRSFVIVTDGYVNVEKEVFDLIRNNNDKANTFVFGIGSSVNRHLLEGIAHVGMGEPFIVLDMNETNEKAEKFREYITSPVLTQIKLDFSNFEVYDVEPITIPDVFAERPIIIYGKYKGKAEGTAKLKGFTGRKRWNAKIDISNFTPDDKNAALRYLWARKSIQMLDDYGSINSSIDKEKVTKLGLKYNLLTNYTSFIAIEEISTNNGELKTVKQALPSPLNVSNSAVGFEFDLEEEIDIDMISFYNEIEIITSLPIAQKEKLQKHIEEILMLTLDSCFMDSNDIESILITIGVEGTVKNIKLDGTTINSELKKCIKKIIQKWSFKSFNLNNEVNFEIRF